LALAARESKIAVSMRPPLLFPIEKIHFLLSTCTLVFTMAGYLDYWCSLDITGTAERDILTVQLETEFDNVDSMVEALIQARQERRLEIARELAPIKARIL